MKLVIISGRSGSGKSTALRALEDAGFNSIEGGEFKFDDKVINEIPAHKRNIGMVFQAYALFPNLTVAQNVAFGLKVKGAPRAERDQTQPMARARPTASVAHRTAASCTRRVGPKAMLVGSATAATHPSC